MKVPFWHTSEQVLYFLVAGSTLGRLVDTTFWKMMGTPVVVIGILIMIAGFIRHHKVRKAIEVSKQNIGSSSDAFIKMARGL